ncbi:MAG: UDP-glucose--hexose-1-phosphate uridylyltransferase [Coriobacteriales bacterium]|jgi:UDPglucose--hexose-1-phosphate uridylyltransferase
MNIASAVRIIIAHSLATGIIARGDERWAANRILEAVGEPGDPGCARAEDVDESRMLPFHEALDLLGERAIANHRANSPDMATSSIMGSIMPRPSEVSRTFGELLVDDPRKATGYLHGLSVASDYIKTRQIARNVGWETPTRWGDLQVTINLSKPEKDPRAIARAAKAPAEGAYPACQLCMENEGYAGRDGDSRLGTHPARQDLRIAQLELGGESWGLQYSPYAYFDEHCIAMNAEHRPMHVDRSCLDNLLGLVGLLPHYFFGSNADLPIVGGSILAHDHFQGGRHEFPMERAADDVAFELRGFADVRARTIAWPLSVIRLTGDDPGKLAAAADAVLTAWREHDDPEAGIVSRTGDVPHNTITPIARRRGDAFELDLALRCNITSDEHPLGVFHPHEELHHIKKENIGLIEVMGLAILPARLERELAAVAGALLSGADLEADEATAPHAAWARDVALAHPELDASNARDILRDEVGTVFARVLEDAGVFKWTPEGRAAQARFLEKLA